MVTSDHFSAKIVVKGSKLKMGLQKKKKKSSFVTLLHVREDIM